MSFVAALLDSDGLTLCVLLSMPAIAFSEWYYDSCVAGLVVMYGMLILIVHLQISIRPRG